MKKSRLAFQHRDTFFYVAFNPLFDGAALSRRRGVRTFSSAA